MWQFIKGKRGSDVIDRSGNRCIRLDGVNDYISANDSEYFNIGLGEFTIAVKIFIVKKNGVNTVIRKRLVGSTGFGMNLTQNTFYMSNEINTQQDIFSVNPSYFPEGQWLTIVVVRRGNNSTISGDTFSTSIRNPNNYNIYVNGVSVPITKTIFNGSYTHGSIDNNAPFYIGTDQFGSNPQIYYDFVCVYNRALTEVEIAGLNNDIPSSGAKGVYVFSGNTIDSSSAGNNATLYNNTLTDDYIYPRVNSIIYYTASGTDVVKDWVAPSNLSVFSFIRFGGITSASYSIDGGTTWNALTFTSDRALVSIPLSKDAVLKVRATTNTNNGTIQINYNNA